MRKVTRFKISGKHLRTNQDQLSLTDIANANCRSRRSAGGSVKMAIMVFPRPHARRSPVDRNGFHVRGKLHVQCLLMHVCAMSGKSSDLTRLSVIS